MPKVIPPNEFTCPITGLIMKDPISYNGTTYERKAIEDYLRREEYPVPGQDEGTKYFNEESDEEFDEELVSNLELKTAIQSFLKERNICTNKRFFIAMQTGKQEEVEKLNYLYEQFYIQVKYYPSFRANNKCWTLMTLLHFAAAYGYESIIRLLLKEDTFNINVLDDRGKTPLHWAIEEGYFDCAQLLLEAGANPNIRCTFEEMTPLHLAATHNHDSSFIKLLLKFKANFNIKSKNGFSSLFLMVIHHNISGIKLLLEAGANPDLNRDETPLFRAVWVSDVAIIQLLLQAGANPNIYTSGYEHNKLTPLVNAIHQRRFDFVKLLLDAKADPNLLTDWGAALHVAANWGDFSCVNLLLAAEADINIQDHNGWTPLHHAVENRHANVAKLLIENGANIEATTNKGQTAIQLAKEYELRNIEKDGGLADSIDQWSEKMKIKRELSPADVDEFKKTIQQQSETIKKQQQEIKDLKDQLNKANESFYGLKLEKSTSTIFEEKKNYRPGLYKK